MSMLFLELWRKEVLVDVIYFKRVLKESQVVYYRRGMSRRGIIEGRKVFVVEDDGISYWKYNKDVDDSGGEIVAFLVSID